MSEISVQAAKRALTTNGAVNKLRREGNVPGVYYTKGTDPISISLSERSLKPLVYTSETHIVNLIIDGTEYKSILKNIQFDPVTDRIIHVDFIGISADQVIEVEVPVILTGQARGVRDGGLVQHTMHKIKVSCLPSYIPEHISIDITNLGLNQSVHVKDLKIENVTFLQHDDVIIVAVVAPRTAVDAAATGDAAAEPEIIGKGKQSEDEE